jgi:hypothetical protein
MKKLLVIALFISIAMIGAQSAMAVEKTYGTAGCGLGSMLLGNEPGMVQILVGTLNGIAGNQTFGITSGTLNCEKTPKKFVSNPMLNDFVRANIDNLAKDVAAGRGESLETLVELTGVSADLKPAIYAKLQTRFSTIFSSEKVESADVVDRIMTIINE